MALLGKRLEMSFSIRLRILWHAILLLVLHNKGLRSIKKRTCTLNFRPIGLKRVFLKQKKTEIMKSITKMVKHHGNMNRVAVKIDELYEKL